MGTSELLDAFQALETVSWTSQEDFHETLAATLAKSQEDRHVLDVLFDRFFFRAVEREAVERGLTEERFTGGEGLDLESLRDRIRDAIRAGADGEMRDLARLAIVAFGRQGEGSGVIGVDVQRIRRSLGLRGERQNPAGAELPDPDSVPRDNLQKFEQHVRRELERLLIERTRALPPARPLRELDRALPSNPTQDLSQVHRVVAQLKRRLATQGREHRGPAPQLAGGRAPHDARVAADRRRAAGPPVPPAAAAAARALRALRRVHQRHQRQRVLPVRAARPPRPVPQAALVRLRGADLRGHRRVRGRALVRGGVAEDLHRRGRGRRLRLHRLRPGVARVPRPGGRRPGPALHGDRARRRPHERPRAARRRVRQGGRRRRAACSGSTPSRACTGTTATR